MKHIVLVFLLFNFVSGAQADGMSGKMLLGYCQSLINAFEKDENMPLTEDELSSSGLCSGYIEGVLDGSYYMRSIANYQYKSVTVTNKPLITDIWSVNIGSTLEVAIVIVNHLKKHPEQQNKTAVDAVYHALRDHFPTK